MSYPEPFDAAKFKAIPKYAYKAPESDVSSEAPLNTGVTLSVTKPTQVTALWVVKNDGGAPVSQSFNNDDGADTPIDPLLHCSIVHGDDPVSVAWKVTNAAGVASAKLEIYSASEKEKPIWTKELTGGDIRTKVSAGAGAHVGCLAFSSIEIPKTKIGDDDDAFPDKWITVEHGPYQIRLTVVPTAGTGDSVAWTFVDVVATEIALSWGADELIPTAPRTDIDWPPGDYAATMTDASKAAIRTRELALLASLRANAVGYAAHEIALASNVFRKTEKGDCDNFYFDMHKKAWGHGPRIPLVASVKVRSAAGASVDAPKAIGNTPFLWDWTDKAFRDEDYRVAKTAAFIKKTSTRKTPADAAPPGSTNCHHEHGGKRGGEPVFPKQNADTAPQAIADGFPFKVVAGATRKWAAFSYARTSGAHAGKTGVLFQPSRISGDTYTVRVVLAKPKATLDCTTAQAALLEANATLPTAASGLFRVYRQVNLTYLRKNADVAVMDLAATVRYYAEAGIKVNLLAQGTMNPAHFKESLQAVMPGPDEAGSVRLAPKLIDPEAPVADGAHGLTYYSWSQLQTQYLAKACRTYAGTSGQVKKMDTAAAEYARNNIGCHILTAQVSWYNGMKASEKRKVDEVKAELLNADGIAYGDEAAYKRAFGNISKTLLQKLSGHYMKGQMAEPGIFFAHFAGKHAWRDLDGTLHPDTTDVGGIAPYPENTLDRAIFLLYMPAADPGEPTMKPDDVTAHEIGHNICLKHAKCLADDSFSGPSYSTEIHLPDEECLMNYYRQDVKALCGYCNLRVRGWATTAGDGVVALSNDATVNAG
ncbi:MAG: hypothetical protein JNM66_23795 [Bryobacterales bacterium]|nr:hypothetical protein [Bryobacterales bacterium]